MNENVNINLTTRLFLRGIYGNKCCYCGKNLSDNDCHIDHIIPQSFGGGNDFGNLVISCKKCNYKKSNKLSEEYLTKVERARQSESFRKSMRGVVYGAFVWASRPLHESWFWCQQSKERNLEYDRNGFFNINNFNIKEKT